ncbi:MAG: hypothetical protein LIO77_10150 [Rikenellaceae bacterium]|nr:hypothetical protein [Rikenellaceae bacterium]
MRRLMLLLAASAIVLSGCSDDDNAGNGGDNGSDELRRISVDASDIKGLSTEEISNVVFYTRYDNDAKEVELATSYWRDGFSMTLPETVGSSYLGNVTSLLDYYHKFDSYDDISVSNSSARITTYTWFEAQNSGYVGNIYISGNDDDWVIRYIYSSAGVNVDGTIEEDNHTGVYDLSLKKGWNRVAYSIKEELKDQVYYHTYTVKTDLPSSLHWRFE